MTKTDGIDTTLTLQVPSDHACYADHFPGNPLVPGALLLKWIILQIEVKFHCDVVQLKHIKFLAIVKPNDLLTTQVTSALNAPSISISVFRDQTLVLKGTLECTLKFATNEYPTAKP